MPKCSFCQKDYEFPRGVSMVMDDGNVYFFCSGKCRKNKFMKRRKVRWIKKSSEKK